MTKRYVIGNWKLSLSDAHSVELARKIREDSLALADLYVGVAPSFTALSGVNGALDGSSIVLGAQNVCWEKFGAYTGEVSAVSLKQAGCSFVIVGHSERRRLMGESNELAAKRAKQALENGLLTIFCVGESDQERSAGETNQVLEQQLKALASHVPSSLSPHLVIAYEPVWAIGTGKVASIAEIEEVHTFLVERLKELVGCSCPILYGGSVTPDNFAKIIATRNVDGGLVGGASLDAGKFKQLCKIAAAQISGR